MKKGFLKIMMFRIISQGEITGYGVIKKVEEMTGIRPSTGAIYPILKSMESKGWVVGNKREGKTYYTITEKGEEKLNAIKELREGYMKKLLQNISFAGEFFDEGCYKGKMDVMSLLIPLITEIISLRKKGVELEKIKEIILRAREELIGLDKGD